MLARPKSVQWEERERVRRQQEEEVKQPLKSCCCASLIAVAQTMKQLQNANVHRNVVKPSKASGHKCPPLPASPRSVCHAALQALPRLMPFPSKSGCSMRLTTGML